MVICGFLSMWVNMICIFKYEWSQQHYTVQSHGMYAALRLPPPDVCLAPCCWLIYIDLTAAHHLHWSQTLTFCSPVSYLLQSPSYLRLLFQKYIVTTQIYHSIVITSFYYALYLVRDGHRPASYKTCLSQYRSPSIWMIYPVLPSLPPLPCLQSDCIVCDHLIVCWKGHLFPTEAHVIWSFPPSNTLIKTTDLKRL